MKAFKHILPEPNTRVRIVPIAENGRVIRCRRDERGQIIIEVKRDSDGETHLCRECEIKIIKRTKIATIYRSGEYMDLYDDGCIGRTGENSFGPSGQWRVVGAVTRNNFGQVIKRWTLEEILADPGAIPWLHANGKGKTFVVDVDHGTTREWGNPCRIFAV